MDIIQNTKPHLTIATLLLLNFGIFLSGNTYAANATTAQLQDEVQARKAADSREINARKAADNTLTNGGATEKAERQAADTTESAARMAANTAEVTARQQAIQAAINALQSQLNAIALPPPPVSGTRPKAGLSLKLCPDNDTPQWEPCLLAIGEIGPAGGIVFYVTDGGIHGLEAAPVDQIDVSWGCEGIAITGADSHTVGSGAQNTLDILAGCNEAGIAAKVADDYTLNGYSDWFLPSIDELTFMLANIGQGAAAPLTNAGGFVADLGYWSSSEFNIYGAWVQIFNQSGNTGSFNKTSSRRVRAIRAF
jgi:hypothetical protein